MQVQIMDSEKNTFIALNSPKYKSSSKNTRKEKAKGKQMLKKCEEMDNFWCCLQTLGKYKKEEKATSMIETNKKIKLKTIAASLSWNSSSEEDDGKRYDEP